MVEPSLNILIFKLVLSLNSAASVSQYFCNSILEYGDGDASFKLLTLLASSLLRVKDVINENFALFFFALFRDSSK